MSTQQEISTIEIDKSTQICYNSITIVKKSEPVINDRQEKIFQILNRCGNVSVDMTRLNLIKAMKQQSAKTILLVDTAKVDKKLITPKTV